MKKWYSEIPVIIPILVVIIIILVVLVLVFRKREGVNIMNWTELSEKEELIEKLEGYKVLSVNTGVGDIELVSSKDDFLRVNATKKVRGENEEKKKQLMENICLEISGQGEQLNVSAHPKENKKLDLWKWKAAKFDPIDLEVDLVIEIPDRFSGYSVSSGVGNIKIKQLRGFFNVKTGVGNLKLMQLALSDESSLKTGTGGISLNISSIADNGKLDINTGVGSIDIQMPEDGSYVIDTESFGEKPKREVINGGEASIRVKTRVGKITLNKI